MTGNNIKKYIHERGIKQAHIVRATGIPKTKLSYLLNGKQKMAVDDYIRICRALNVKDYNRFIDKEA